MRTSYFPSTDAGLLSWSRNFSDKLNLSPESYGVSPEAAANYASVTADFAAAMLACQPGVRNKVAVNSKNAVQSSLKEAARLLVFTIKGTAAVTDAQKIDLGLNVPAQATLIPAPVNPPVVNVVSVVGRRVRIRLHDSETLQRVRPTGATGASVYSFVGALPAEGGAEFKFEGNFSRRTIDIVFPLSIPPGTQVWVAARWINAKLQAGPLSNAVSTHIQYGPVMEAA